MKPYILVTGANGQLGQTIQELYEKECNNYNFVFVTKEAADITDTNSLNKFFSSYHFKYCINCAAYTNVDKAEEQPELAHKVNAEGVKNLATICKEKGTILIHISTDYVFDGKKNEPYTEEDETNPINEYGKSKLAGEVFVKETLDAHFIIRTSWLYSKYGKNFVKTISKKVAENADLKVVNSETGTPTNCIDLTRFIFHLVTTENNKYGIFHFSNLGKATWYDFAVEIATQYPKYNLNKLTPTDFFKTLAKRPRYSVLNKEKAERNSFKIPEWKNSLKTLVK